MQACGVDGHVIRLFITDSGEICEGMCGVHAPGWETEVGAKARRGSKQEKSMGCHDLQ